MYGHCQHWHWMYVHQLYTPDVHAESCAWKPLLEIVVRSDLSIMGRRTSCVMNSCQSLRLDWCFLMHHYVVWLASGATYVGTKLMTRTDVILQGTLWALIRVYRPSGFKVLFSRGALVLLVDISVVAIQYESLPSFLTGLPGHLGMTDKNPVYSEELEVTTLHTYLSCLYVLLQFDS